jgi:hypothetical protein
MDIFDILKTLVELLDAIARIFAAYRLAPRQR